ncbi:MAG: hypothetical protein KKA32_01595 [Actinobacteria bacterium]|nr:hypothetical protein [Actinomycetota bacterium]
MTTRTGDSRRWFAPLIASGLVLLAFASGGCKIEMSLDTVIEADGSGTVGVRLAADKEMRDLIAQQAGDESDLFGEFESGVPEGWESSSDTDADGTRWVKATRSFADPAELEALLAEGTEEAQGPADSIGAQDFSLSQERTFFTVKTEFSADWDPAAAMAEVSEEAPLGTDLASLASIFQVENRVTLPGSIKDHNADLVEGNTLVWQPLVSGVTQMTASSVAYRWPAIAGVALAVLVLLGAIGAGAYLGVRRSRTEVRSPV